MPCGFSTGGRWRATRRAVRPASASCNTRSAPAELVTVDQCRISRSVIGGAGLGQILRMQHVGVAQRLGESRSRPPGFRRTAAATGTVVDTAGDGLGTLGGTETMLDVPRLVVLDHRQRVRVPRPRPRISRASSSSQASMPATNAPTRLGRCVPSRRATRDPARS